MYEILLVIHVGSGIVGTVYALFVLTAGAAKRLTPHFRATPVIYSFVFQIISGSCLAIAAADVSVLSLCRALVAYGVLYLGALLMLRVRAGVKTTTGDHLWLWAGLSCYAASLALGF